jgi:hypothetical protein
MKMNENALSVKVILLQLLKLLFSNQMKKK